MPVGGFGGDRGLEGTRWTIIKTDQNEPIVHVLAALDSERFQPRVLFFSLHSDLNHHRSPGQRMKPAYRQHQRWTVISKNEKEERAGWHSRRV